MLLYLIQEHGGMLKDFTLRVQLSQKQKRRLKWACKNQEQTMSEIIRAFIATLPEPPEDWTPSDE